MEDQIKLKIEQYNAKVKAGSLKSLKMDLITDIHEMPLNKLRSGFTNRIDGYFVEELNLIKVNKAISVSAEDKTNRYPTNNLLIDCHTVKLIEMIETGEKIIPPEIIYIKKDLWKIVDGQHRFSLIRYLEFQNGPFLIRREHMQYLKDLLLW